MQAVLKLPRTQTGLAIVFVASLLYTSAAEAGRPRPGLPDAPSVTVVAAGESIATGWISACTKGGAPLATCTQQVRIVAQGSDCSAEAIATAIPSTDETWVAFELSEGTRYTLFGVSSNATGNSCSDPLNFTAAGEAPRVDRVRFYPSMEYMFAPPFSTGATQVRFILRADPPIMRTSEITVPIDSNGEFRATVTCNFAGDGVLDVVDDSPGSGEELFDSIPVLCDVPEEPSEISGPEGLTLFTLEEEPPVVPPTIRGKFIGYTLTVNSTLDESTVSSSPDEDDVTHNRNESHLDTIVFDGVRECLTSVSTINSDPRRKERCSDKAPPRILWIGGTLATASGTQTREYFNPPGKLKTRSVTTKQSSVNQSVQFTVAFPDVPPGAIVQAIRIRQDNSYDFSSSADTGFVLNGPGGASSTSTWTETSRGGPCPSISGRDWVWLFPEPAQSPDHTYQFQLTPSTNCTEAYSEEVISEDLWRRWTHGPSTSTHGTLTLPIYAEADLIASGLRLKASRERAFPVTPFRHQNFFGISSATVTAALINPPVGSYTIRIRLDSFDAETEAGHSHGVPPEAYWGEIWREDPVEDQMEISCPVEITETETTKSCTATFQADEISGAARFVASVDELPGVEDEEKIDVGFFSLADASSFLTRPNERRRNADTRHIDAKSFYVKSIGVLQGFIAKYQALTAPPPDAPQTTPPSLGRYMNFNDFSLPRGGKFDINGQWSASDQKHAYHRDGEGVDVMNDKDTDIATGAQVTIQRRTFDRACEASGGIVIKEGPFHCEFGSKP